MACVEEEWSLLLLKVSASKQNVRESKGGGKSVFLQEAIALLRSTLMPCMMVMDGFWKTE